MLKQVLLILVLFSISSFSIVASSSSYSVGDFEFSLEGTVLDSASYSAVDTFSYDQPIAFVSDSGFTGYTKWRKTGEFNETVSEQGQGEESTDEGHSYVLVPAQASLGETVSQSLSFIGDKISDQASVLDSGIKMSIASGDGILKIKGGEGFGLYFVIVGFLIILVLMRKSKRG